MLLREPTAARDVLDGGTRTGGFLRRRRDVKAIRDIAMRSLQSRILALFLLVMVIVQLGSLLLINTVGVSAARKTVGDALVSGARVFDRLLEQDTRRTVQGARLMSSDYAFREVISTGDRQTIGSVLVNYGKRIDASVMMLIGLDHRVVGDTLNVSTDEPFPFPNLIAEAEQNRQSSATVVIRGQLYQLVVVPVLAPLPVAWVAIGFAVNDARAQDFTRLTQLEVSFLSRKNGEGWRLQGTTLTNSERLALLDDVGAGRYAASDEQGNAIFSDSSVTRVLNLPTRSDETVIAVLQEPLSSALEPFHHLLWQVGWISVLALAVSLFCGAVIARGITRPVDDLVRSRAAHRGRQLQRGDRHRLAQRRDRRSRDGFREHAAGNRQPRVAQHGSRVPGHADRASQPGAVHGSARQGDRHGCER